MEYIPAKQILRRNRSTAWFGTDYTMNLYRGCCHGCIYCDSRSACYGIEDFGRVRAKENALALLRDELRRKVRPGIVGMGSMSDPYNPFEGERQLTRHALELLDAYGCGAAIATSSMATEMAKGKSIDEALQLTNKAVAEALDGLPPVKMHCSLLAEQAIHAAVEDYQKKHPKE